MILTYGCYGLITEQTIGILAVKNPTCSEHDHYNILSVFFFFLISLLLYQPWYSYDQIPFVSLQDKAEQYMVNI